MVFAASDNIRQWNNVGIRYSAVEPHSDAAAGQRTVFVVVFVCVSV